MLRILAYTHTHTHTQIQPRGEKEILCFLLFLLWSLGGLIEQYLILKMYPPVVKQWELVPHNSCWPIRYYHIFTMHHNSENSVWSTSMARLGSCNRTLPCRLYDTDIKHNLTDYIFWGGFLEPREVKSVWGSEALGLVCTTLLRIQWMQLCI